MTVAWSEFPRWHPRWSAILAIAAAYFHFLIFAEFAFLNLAGGIGQEAASLRLFMGALGVGGIAGSVGAAVAFRRSRANGMLAWAFRSCAVGGLLALVATELPAMLLAAVLSGMSLGALTVTLASTLRDALGRARLGLGIGTGTGIAYAICNIPWIFNASPQAQAILATIVVTAASFLPRFFHSEDPGPSAAESVPDGTAGRQVLRWVVILVALVWLDSAAFYIIQHAPALRAETWGSARTLIANAGIHLVAAIVAGAWIDRGGRAPVAGVAIAALAVAGLILGGMLPPWVSANWWYTAGVSFYSVVLVEFPARTGRPAIAALIFAIAGWGGSAAGIGMAQDLAEIPVAFIAIALVVVVAGVLWRPGAGAALSLLALALPQGTMRADEVVLGREVYIAEGCIHCHSQYIRPRVEEEVLNWGPAKQRGESLEAEPPLFGTRRQGPDLSNVGIRRSAEWNRLHLIAPRVVSPGSRMPSYAHLFAPGDPRGGALVDYLASLGSEAREARRSQEAAWHPTAPGVIDGNAAARLFARSCAQCHGVSGRGDGVLAHELSVRPPDWSATRYRHVGPGEEVETALSRIIKFGIPGLPMAGHEYLPDAEIVGLARHVMILHKGTGENPSVVVPK